MAMLVDHKRKTELSGSVAYLIECMIAAQMEASRFNCATRERHAVAVVKSAIRRSGCTDARQQLIMSSDERKRWEMANPIDA